MMEIWRDVFIQYHDVDDVLQYTPTEMIEKRQKAFEEEGEKKKDTISAR